MPTDRRNIHPTKFKVKPWHARATAYGIRYSLGYYATEGEALEAEIAFMEANGMERPITQAERQARNQTILKLHASGMTHRAVAEKLGLTRAVVQTVVRKKAK